MNANVLFSGKRTVGGEEKAAGCGAGLAGGLRRGGRRGGNAKSSGSQYVTFVPLELPLYRGPRGPRGPHSVSSLAHFDHQIFRSSSCIISLYPRASP
jgi:hypothetical protein